MVDAKRRWSDYLANILIGAVIGLALQLPYAARVRLIGWVVARVVSPLAGWPKRIRANLALILPDLPASEADAMVRAVPNNFGRALIESYSRQDFIDRAAALPLTGPGAAALEAARYAGRPVILVTGHFGNHQVPRAALVARGYTLGAVYMPMSNGYFNDRYVAELEQLGKPMFARSRQGLVEMVKFLRGGGMVGMVADHRMTHGTPLDFMGQPAYTALSAAEMALKYDAALIPIYARRLSDGLSFEIIVDAEVPASDPVTMTQALNDSLARLVMETPEQWFWIHKRWKVPDGRGDGA